MAELFGGGEGPLALTYVDTPKLLDVVYPLLVIGGHAMASEMAREGIDMNLAALPSAGAIRPHLRPSIGVVRRTAAGVELDSRATVPGTGIAPAAAVLPFLMFQAKAAVPVARRTESMNTAWRCKTTTGRCKFSRRPMPLFKRLPYQLLRRLAAVAGTS